MTINPIRMSSCYFRALRPILPIVVMAGALPISSPAQFSAALSGPTEPMTASSSAEASSGSATNKPSDTAGSKKTSIPPVHVDVVVKPGIDSSVSTGATAYQVSARDILSSAGTYGDFSRYLQLFPGVTFNSDESDDVLVRGGNPIENLYRVDGFDVPNINHIATEGTTGGLVSMIDTSAIENLDFLTSGYDASYDERLSSVVDIHTRESSGGRRYTQGDVGFVGAGLTMSAPLHNGGSYLISAHRSLLNLFTDDIGLNGVPIYTNGLGHATLAVTPSDTVSLLILGGGDSIKIKPEASDVAETNTIDTQYSGWRGTTGLRWQHLFNPNSFGAFTFSDSEDVQDIQQQDQLYDGTMPTNVNPDTYPTVPVYSEHTHDGTSSLKYEVRAMRGPFSISAGLEVRYHRIAYDVAQPAGEYSPFSADTDRSDATSFSPRRALGESGQYIQVSYRPTHRWTVGAGIRHEEFDYDFHQTGTPRLSSAYQVTHYLTAHVSFGEYAQLPPYIYLLAFSQNNHLTPIHDRQITAGFDMHWAALGTIKFEAYRKDYKNYPVSSEYPTLSMANMVDTLGQEFIWLPLVSDGKGRASGIELSAESHIRSHLFFMENASLARDKFSGLDGVLRPGNFDYPFVLNAAGSYRSGRHYEVSYRYEYSSGRPYTPFQLTASAAQNRPIYDMSQVNALRGPVYSRLDFSVTRNFFIGERALAVYGGLENALDRQNFLGYAWTPRVGVYWPCGPNPAGCVAEETQMGLFPNFGARFNF